MQRDSKFCSHPLTHISYSCLWDISILHGEFQININSRKFGLILFQQTYKSDQTLEYEIQINIRPKSIQNQNTLPNGSVFIICWQRHLNNNFMIQPQTITLSKWIAFPTPLCIKMFLNFHCDDTKYYLSFTQMMLSVKEKSKVRMMPIIRRNLLQAKLSIL